MTKACPECSWCMPVWCPICLIRRVDRRLCTAFIAYKAAGQVKQNNVVVCLFTFAGGAFIPSSYIWSDVNMMISKIHLKANKKKHTSSWWFQPLWKIWSSKSVHLPPIFGVKIPKMFKTTTQTSVLLKSFFPWPYCWVDRIFSFLKGGLHFRRPSAMRLHGRCSGSHGWILL